MSSGSDGLKLGPEEGMAGEDGLALARWREFGVSLWLFPVVGSHGRGETRMEGMRKKRRQCVYVVVGFGLVDERAGSWITEVGPLEWWRALVVRRRAESVVRVRR